MHQKDDRRSAHGSGYAEAAIVRVVWHIERIRLGLELEPLGEIERFGNGDISLLKARRTTLPTHELP